VKTKFVPSIILISFVLILAGIGLFYGINSGSPGPKKMTETTSSSPVIPISPTPEIKFIKKLKPSEVKKVESILDEVNKSLASGDGVEAVNILQKHQSASTFGCKWYFNGGPLVEGDSIGQQKTKTSVAFSIEAWKKQTLAYIKQYTTETTPLIEHSYKNGKVVHEVKTRHTMVAVALQCAQG